VSTTFRVPAKRTGVPSHVCDARAALQEREQDSHLRERSDALYSLSSMSTMAGAREAASPDASYRELLSALEASIRVLAQDGNETEALKESFGHSARGFGAQEALLLRVVPGGQRLERIHHLGRLSPEQIEACIHGQSVPGVSPSVIRRAITETRSQLIQNSLDGERVDLTMSLANAAHSVLAAPVIDPWTQTVRAVLYYQSLAHVRTYTVRDLPTLEAYATTLSQAFGLFLASQRRYRELHEDWQRLKSDRERSEDVPEIVGDSEEVSRLRAKLHETYIPATQNARPDPILILGPTGAGKDVVARYLHYYSPTRSRRRFVAFNCAGLRGDLAEKMLFGAVKGSFTGSVRDEPGLFREADGGTLFLDEVGELPTEGQSLLLRVLDHRTVRPVGHSGPEIPVNVQIILATNRDLSEAVGKGLFREDLYHRVKNLTIRLSPLALRPGDLRPLITHFFDRHQRRLRKRTKGISPRALAALLSYPWPGNVRELNGVCGALVTHARAGEMVDMQLLQEACPDLLGGPTRTLAADLPELQGSFAAARADFERSFLVRRLDECGWNVAEAAKSLGMHVATLYRTLDRHGLRSAQGAQA
jgi:transcriptional regulator with GAF, ATPase, and Fis domain